MSKRVHLSRTLTLASFCKGITHVADDLMACGLAMYWNRCGQLLYPFETVINTTDIPCSIGDVYAIIKSD